MRPARSTRILIPLLLAAMMAMVTAGFLFLYLQGRSNDRILAEYLASQAAPAAAETYVLSGDLAASDLPAGLSAFGVYSPDGQAIARVGDAPAALQEVPAAAAAASQGGSHTRLLGSDRVMIVRPLGGPGLMGGPGSMGTPGPAGTRGLSQGTMRGRRGAMGEARPIMYALYDAGRALAGRRIRDLLLIGFALLFVVLAGAAYLLYRRLFRYREIHRAQQQMVQLGEAARTLAHEIKNPLGAIRLQQKILERTAPPELQGSVRVISEEVGRIAMLTDRVREFLRNPLGSPEPTDLVELVRAVAERLPFAVEVRTDHDGSCTARVDRERFRAALTNLLQNAWESMADSAGSTKEEIDAVEVAIERSRRTVTLRVLDRGTGISDADKARVFDPFFTTKNSGSGVGLAITQRFITAAGGSISVRDRAGGGTEF
ncbi:sensor histidine kinase, partial [Salinispira pacifica]